MSETNHQSEQAESLWHRVERLGMHRRDFLTLLAAGGTAAVLAACGAEEEAEPTAAPTQEVMAPTDAPAPTAEPATDGDDGQAEAEPRLHVKPLPEAFFIVHGASVEMRWQPLADDAYLMDSGAFFVRNHAESPILDPADWRLRILGSAVENEIELTYEDLLGMPAQTVTRYVECAGNGRAMYDLVLEEPAEGTQWLTGGYGIGTWTGVRLSEILNQAGLMDSAVSVMGTGLDTTQFQKPMPVEKALMDDTLVVYGMNGGPLPYDHGFPARLLVPGYAGSFNVKWLDSIEVADEQLYSKWNTSSYVFIGPEYEDPEGPPEGEIFYDQTLKSAIALPWPATLTAGEQTITGYAWSPFAEIQQVEVSLDGGESWQAAELFGPNIAAAGTRWRFTFDAQAGDMTITTRATDAAGNTQLPVAEQVWNEKGYNWAAVIPHPVTVSG